MCGIVGIISKRNVVSMLVDGLKRLEYRGYDSAGIAILDHGKVIQRIRTKGKVKALEDAVKPLNLSGHIGIAHTRWATHGEPSEDNAHPHMSDNIVLVHNGIVENYEEYKHFLKKEGYIFNSDTDTETIAHLIHFNMAKGLDFVSAVRDMGEKLNGSYALAIINHHHNDTIIVIRKGSPLVIGLGIDENFVASDQLALLPYTKEFIFLEEGDLALITTDNIIIYDNKGGKINRGVVKTTSDYSTIEKGIYKHYMLKEIFEQPDAISATIHDRIALTGIIEQSLESILPIINKVQNVCIVACGTSYHAGLVAKYWIEELANISCAVDIASEYRYRNVPVPNNTLFISISQSGETADTLAALRLAKTKNYIGCISICNVPESTMVREADYTILTRAGREIGVASTKAFATQLGALIFLSLVLTKYRNKEQYHICNDIIKDIVKLPYILQEILLLNNDILALANTMIDKQHVIFLGRGINYPLALEGALKLKEISYIHAEAYPAGELKHGPLALVDANMPVVVIAPNDDLLEKIKSNINEVYTRGGKIYILTDDVNKFGDSKDFCMLQLPKINQYLSPIIYSIPLQLLAYHVACLKGTDVDQPRNLAKSVTVE